MLRWAFVLLAACWLIVWPRGDARCEVRQNDLDLRARILIGKICMQGGEDQPVRLGGSAPTREKSVVKAMLLSALLPGLGQIYAGETRGYATGGVMAATDLFSAWRYFANDGKGDDKKKEYRQFAREHYSRERFLLYADTIAANSDTTAFDVCHRDSHYDEDKCSQRIDEYFPLSKSDDNKFYQQIGDEDIYVFGWDDLPPQRDYSKGYWVAWRPGRPIPDSIRTTSAHRQEYNGMRDRADDYYGKADRYAWIMVIGRVISMVDSAVLVKLRNRDLAGAGTTPHLSLKVNPFGKFNMKVGVKVRF